MSDRLPRSVGPKVRRMSAESPPGKALSGPSPVRQTVQMPDRTRSTFAGLFESLLLRLLASTKHCTGARQASAHELLKMTVAKKVSSRIALGN